MMGVILKSFIAFGEHLFWNALQPLCNIFLEFLFRGVAVPFHLQFEFGEQEAVWGTHMRRVWRMVEDCGTFCAKKCFGFVTLCEGALSCKRKESRSHHSCVKSAVHSSLVYQFVLKATNNSNDGLLSMPQIDEQHFRWFALG